MSHLRFACGARLPAEGDLKEQPDPGWTRRPKDGHARLCVYDSEGGITRPEIVRPEDARGRLWRAGAANVVGAAPCRFECPKKRASGRREQRCFPSDEWSAAHPGETGWRWVVTCYAEEVPR